MQVPFDDGSGPVTSKRYVESPATWAQSMPRERIPAFAGMTLVGAGMMWVGVVVLTRVTREHEFSLWFVGLCRIVSISIDGGRGIADCGLMIGNCGLQDVSLGCGFDGVVIVQSSTKVRFCQMRIARFNPWAIHIDELEAVYAAKSDGTGMKT